MSRNTTFRSPVGLTPFANHDRVHLEPRSVRGPLPFFNPTRARFHVDQEPERPPEPSGKQPPGKQVAVPQATINWRSRDNRKGRHALGVDSSHPVSTSTFRAVLDGLRRMCTECPYWDVSYLVAVFFTVGCLVFILCGLFDWLPLVAPSTEFPNEHMASGITSFIGATLFQVGAVLLVFEAFNESRTGCFGWAISQVIAPEEAATETPGTGGVLVDADKNNCQHHHQGSRRKDVSDMDEPRQEWIWWPSWYDLKTHYIRQIGFVASTSLALGATIFYICGICSIPGVFDNMSLGLARGLYWFTYLLGGVIFIFSSVLYTLENQETWYMPAPHLLGWHIGVWNLIGSIGWTLAASFGYCTSSGCEYQSALTLLWASFAFFVGSSLLWYEALQKYPVERESK